MFNVKSYNVKRVEHRDGSIIVTVCLSSTLLMKGDNDGKPGQWGGRDGSVH